MANYFMGIDTGTQGVRIGICDEYGTIVTSFEEKWETRYPRISWAEQSPLDWWEAICRTLNKCCGELTKEQRRAIKACCVCSTSSTVFAIDKEGNPLMDAMMWMDARSQKEMEAVNDTGHQVLDYCGGKTSFEWMLPKALWTKKNRKNLYEQCYKLIEQLDWVNFKLCGEFASSICNTTCKWHYISSKGGFQREFMEAIGLEDYEEKLITNVLRIGEPVGRIRSELAEEFGFSPDMEVVEGGVDAHMAMFGLNVTRPGKLGIIMGTSFVHLCLKEGEKPQMDGIWGPYDSAVMDGMWLLEGGQISASGLVNWFRENFHIEAKDGNPYGHLIDSLKETKPGADGITVLDYFQGNRTPYKNARAKGVIYGLNVEHTWKEIYRGVVEGVSFGTSHIIENFERQGYPIDTITACGGVTKDQEWIQMIADITGKPIVINRDSQAGVLGCCVAAASGGRCYENLEEAAGHMVHPARTVEPDMEKHRMYEKPYGRYLRLYQCLQDMMNQED